MYTLKDAPMGSTVSVIKIHGAGPIKRRIMDMGITKDCKIKLVRTAPLGDPIEMTLRGYQLSLRKEDATMIEVKLEG